MEFAMHQSLMELMSDWSKRQSCGELMTQKILTSANIRILQYWTAAQMMMMMIIVKVIIK
jgi:hypothetical protein